MKYWYVAVTVDGKDTILAAERTLAALGEALGFRPNAVNYFYQKKLVCGNLNARIIRYPENMQEAAVWSG